MKKIILILLLVLIILLCVNIFAVIVIVSQNNSSEHNEYDRNDPKNYYYDVACEEYDHIIISHGNPAHLNCSIASAGTLSVTRPHSFLWTISVQKNKDFDMLFRNNKDFELLVGKNKKFKMSVGKSEIKFSGVIKDNYNASYEVTQQMLDQAPVWTICEAINTIQSKITLIKSRRFKYDTSAVWEIVSALTAIKTTDYPVYSITSTR